MENGRSWPGSLRKCPTRSRRRSSKLTYADNIDPAAAEAYARGDGFGAGGFGAPGNAGPRQGAPFDFGGFDFNGFTGGGAKRTGGGGGLHDIFSNIFGNRGAEAAGNEPE